MKCKSLLALLLVIICIFMFSACGPDARTTSAGKLVSGYFNLTDQTKNEASILAIKTYGTGYLASALYTGSGNHLVLFKIEKDSAGAEKITAIGEGGAAEAYGCSLNIVTDGGKTIVFGNFKANDQGKSGYSKIDITFDNDSKVSESVNDGMGFIAVTDGSLKVKDFALPSSGKGAAGSYQEYIKAGGSITRTSFTPMK